VPTCISLPKLKELGYDQIVYDVIDLSYYGVPQSRKRFSLIATRLNNVEVHLPQRDEKQALLSDFIGVDKGFPHINKESRILYPIQIGIIASVLRPDEPNLPIQIDNQLRNYR
jgi:site-specific DNA-cytosine methylase